MLPAGAARRFGDREGLTFQEHRWSFREIDAEVDRLARGPIALGVAPGEKVCIWLVNCPEWIFLGRYKDMPKVGGENVDPVEVEAHLLRQPGVRQVAVVGAPDAHPAEVPVAFVVPAPGPAGAGVSEPLAGEAMDAGAEELIASFRGRVASFKIPRAVWFVDELPMTSSGKVPKAVLRDEARRRLGGV